MVRSRGLPRRPRPPRLHRQPPVPPAAGRGGGRGRLHRRAATPPGPRHRRRGHDSEQVGGLVGRGRGRLPGAGRPLPEGGRGRLVDGRVPRLLVGRGAPGDRRDRRCQSAGRAATDRVPWTASGPCWTPGPRSSTASDRTSPRKVPSRPLIRVRRWLRRSRCSRRSPP